MVHSIISTISGSFSSLSLFLSSSIAFTSFFKPYRNGYCRHQLQRANFFRCTFWQLLFKFKAHFHEHPVKSISERTETAAVPVNMNIMKTCPSRPQGGGLLWNYLSSWQLKNRRCTSSELNEVAELSGFLWPCIRVLLKRLDSRALLSSVSRKKRSWYPAQRCVLLATGALQSWAKVQISYGMSVPTPFETQLKISCNGFREQGSYVGSIEHRPRRGE